MSWITYFCVTFGLLLLFFFFILFFLFHFFFLLFFRTHSVIFTIQHLCTFFSWSIRFFRFFCILFCFPFNFRSCVCVRRLVCSFTFLADLMSISFFFYFALPHSKHLPFFFSSVIHSVIANVPWTTFYMVHFMPIVMNDLFNKFPSFASFFLSGSVKCFCWIIFFFSFFQLIFAFVVQSLKPFWLIYHVAQDFFNRILMRNHANGVWHPSHFR